MQGTTDSERVIVLGLDGVPWELLRRWAVRGELKAFSRLFESGAAGPLESTVPASTALAWPSIATGVWPDQHGLYGFQRLDADYTHRMNTAVDRRHPALWDVLTPAVVGNVPMTYPAAEIEGAMVAGMLTPALDDSFAHPPALAEEIADRFPDYRTELDWQRYSRDPDAILPEISSLVETRRAIMERLFEVEDWRLFFFVYTAPDRLQHLRWDEDTLLTHYRQLDEILGDVMEYTAETRSTLLVVSDHGFGPVEKRVHVNTVLEREGFLERERDGGVRRLLGRIGLTRDRIVAGLERLGLDEETLLRNVPRSLLDGVAGQFPGTHALYDVDFSETVAFMHGQGNVYVNDESRFEDGTVAAADVEDVRAAVANVLEEFVDPDSGDPALTVHDGAELFERDDRAPDLVVASDRFCPAATLADEPFTDAGGMEANHQPEGIFLAWGPSIDPAAAPEAATVVDVAPTALHALGDPVPAAADGRVLSEIFDPDSPAGQAPVRTREYGDSDHGAGVDADFDGVESRLRGLGYLE